jgi:hypothetical protein
MDENVGVRVRAEVMACFLKLGPELSEVIDLAVVRNPDGVIFIWHWLIGERREIDNAKAGMPKDATSAFTPKSPHRVRVRPAVRKGANRALDR